VEIQHLHCLRKNVTIAIIGFLMLLSATDLAKTSRGKWDFLSLGLPPERCLDKTLADCE